MTKKYVLGFAIWNNFVALIHKTKGPSYVIGTWNGIGGKVEQQDDTLELAMMREFAEETHLVISPDLWHHFATQKGSSGDGEEYELNCFVAHLPDDRDFSMIENTEGDGEEVAWHSLLYPLVNPTPNLDWLIPLALDKTTGYLEIREY